MAQMPKKPQTWGEDMEDIQINPNPLQDAPVTVTDPAALARPAPDMGAGPDPTYYAKMGEMARQLMSDPHDTDGMAAVGGVIYDAAHLLQFQRGHSLDAQSYGASPAYGNYAFGVYNAARGAALPETLDLANLYGKYRSTYDPRKFTMDRTYTSIPVQNVQNITRGYNDYQNGTLHRGP